MESQSPNLGMRGAEGRGSGNKQTYFPILFYPSLPIKSRFPTKLWFLKKKWLYVYFPPVLQLSGPFDIISCNHIKFLEWYRYIFIFLFLVCHPHFLCGKPLPLLFSTPDWRLNKFGLPKYSSMCVLHELQQEMSA